MCLPRVAPDLNLVPESSPIPPHMSKSLVRCFFAGLLVGSAFLSSSYAQGEASHQANFTFTAPTIDGIRTAGEWDDAEAAENEFLLLRTAQMPVAEEVSFQVLWDDEAMYLIYESAQQVWRTEADWGGGNNFNFTTDSLNLYIDPDTDDEANTNPPDDYQMVFWMPIGVTTRGNTAEDPIERHNFLEAHLNTPFGNNAGWDAASTDFTYTARVENGVGGVIEICIPWSDFDAQEFDPVETRELHHTEPPENGDSWYLAVCQISSRNTLPVWNWTGAQGFTDRPHGILTFAGKEGRPLRFTAADYDGETNQVSLTWMSKPGLSYAIEFSKDMTSWEEIDDSHASEGFFTSFIDVNLPDAPLRRYYRVRESEG